MSLQRPRITFGIIVLNGEPFTRYCLRAIYPYAHEIIVVEGGCARSAEAIATPDGHSLDGTLEVLRQFKAEEDPENKLQIVTRDGFWSEKDEQSQAYAERATGDYLWQVDIDEFYTPRDIEKVIELLATDPSITAMSFKQIKFWGGFDYVVDGWYPRRGSEIYHRLFKWGPGYRYVTHRPPTVHDDQGRDVRKVHWVNGYAMAEHGVFLYHYSLLLPQQVLNKSSYYSRVKWADHSKAEQWAEDVYVHLRRPYRVHNVYALPSWLERFAGQHPPAVVEMRRDLESGKRGVEMRRTDDIEQLLRSPWYALGRAFLAWLEPYDRRWGKPFWQWKERIEILIHDPARGARALRRRLQRAQQ